MLTQDYTKDVRILHDGGNQARQVVGAKAQVEDGPPRLPRRSLHGEQAEIARQGTGEMPHGVKLGQHSNLRNLGRPFRRGDDKDGRAEGPIVDVENGAEPGYSAHHATRQIVTMCIGGEAGHELGGREQMPCDGMVGRH